MANVPKKISTGNRTVVGNQVLNAGDSLVEREQLNRILKGIDERLVALGVRVDNIPSNPGNPGDGASYELSVDPSNFSLDSVGDNAWYLDIIPGGIGTVELADLSVTYDKIDFTTFDSDVVVEGTTNLYFTDERAQDAVGVILDPGFFVDLIYDDLVPAITADLSATGSPSFETVLRGDNRWVDNVYARWYAGSLGITAFESISVAVPTPFGDLPSFTSGRHVGVFYITTTGGSTVDGVDNPYAGRLVSIYAVTSDLVINHDSGVVAGNGILTPDGSPYTLEAGNCLTLLYGGSRWGFFSTTGGGGGGSGVVETIVAGDGIAVDSTDPANPVVSATAQLGGITVTAGAVGGPLLPVGTSVSGISTADYEITGWKMWCDPSGDLEVDIRKVPFGSLPPGPANSITGSGRPEITASNSASGNVALWSDTTINVGDAITAVITGATTVRWFTLSLEGTRTVT